jgi:hypothetical protein
MAPFPIKPGQSWQSASIDITHQHPMELNGQVLKREVIDVCGTLIEGWHVHSTLNDAGQTSTLDYLIATQYGGVIAALALDGTYIGLKFSGVKTRVGQIDPRALPKGMK